jgi:hypothetical protein
MFKGDAAAVNRADWESMSEDDGFIGVCVIQKKGLVADIFASFNTVLVEGHTGAESVDSRYATN